VARNPEHREDLMRDATALVERAEVVWHPEQPPLILGRRATGATSLYFGEEPVYHFTSEGRVRRAHVDGLLYKAAAGELVEIRPVRVPGEVQLRSRVLSPQEQAEFLKNLADRLQQLLARFDSGDCKVIAEIPADEPVVAPLVEWIRQQLTRPLQGAVSPHAR
jgi:hypothetical protein